MTVNSTKIASLFAVSQGESLYLPDIKRLCVVSASLFAFAAVAGCAARSALLTPLRGCCRRRCR
jgi:hypothetical protein